jgi:hypothetical protein
VIEGIGEWKKKKCENGDAARRAWCHGSGRRANRVEHEVAENSRWMPMVCDGPGDFWDARARWLMMGEVVKTQVNELGVTAGAVLGPLVTVLFSTAPAQDESCPSSEVSRFTKFSVLGKTDDVYHVIEVFVEPPWPGAVLFALCSIICLSRPDMACVTRYLTVAVNYAVYVTQT